ncbi:unnamed protein product [Dovyalis caffra]|uniref:Uncharacterized protein n=1 Tax=Dovyalis caffra TaxID=77055 RepID=A0AAV1S1U7_9ROSI|nr:unnamed protein product [Dovyalis caffra]
MVIRMVNIIQRVRIILRATLSHHYDSTIPRWMKPSRNEEEEHEKFRNCRNRSSNLNFRSHEARYHIEILDCKQESDPRSLVNLE